MTVGPIFYYDVTVRSLDDGIIRSTQRTSQTTAQFSNLLNGTDYNISVAAVNRAGSGPSSTINVTGNAIGTYINNVKGWMQIYEAKQMVNLITSCNAYEKSSDLVIRKELKTSLYTIL